MAPICTQIHTNNTAIGTIELSKLSILCPSCLPTIGHWLASATERAGTCTIFPGQGDKEDTAEIVTLPTRVTFQPGTTAGRIFAKRLVLMDLQPGMVSDFLLSVLLANPTFKDSGPQVEQCRH